MTDQELIAAAMPAEDEFIEFDGWNCNDGFQDVECAGWDGRSRRCNCGNRRVSWEVEYGIARGVAY